MSTVTSKDGTRLAYDRIGKGPAVILVNGSLAYRALFGHGPLAAQLADHFTVYTYDRRGRGESGNTLPYAVEREIEDLEALIDEAGGSACVYGDSSGAALVMEAAIRLGDKIRKIAMYEVPYNSDDAARQAWKEYTKQLDELLAAGRRGDALALFMMLTGASAGDIDGVRQSPEWPVWEAVAPTLAYDHSALLGEDASVPTERAASVAVPALVMDGSESYPFMHVAAAALANAMPYGQHRTLEGQTHEVAAEAIAPILVEFFNLDPKGFVRSSPNPWGLDQDQKRKTNMGKVIFSNSISLDGFVAGPNDSPENPLGDGGEALFKWYFSGDIPFTIPGDVPEFKVSRASAEVLKEGTKDIGAMVAGRRMFDIANAWQGHPPGEGPCFIVTHSPPQEWVKEGSPFIFVTDGVESAIQQAKAAAGHKNVAVSSASIAKQCIRAGLLDEIHIDLVPVLLGGGVRLFEHLGIEPIELETIKVVDAPGVTHLGFRIVK